MFQDLIDAIKDVLQSAEKAPWFTDNKLQRFYFVDERSLKILQAEYNIYFVEPYNKQLEIIK